LLVLGVVLAGCAPSVAQSSVDPPTGEAAEKGQLLGSLYQDLFVMSEAEDVVIQDCMAQKGWTYFDGGVNVDEASSNKGAYVIDYDLAPREAAERGYAFYVERRQRLSTRDRTGEASQQHRRGLSKQQRQARQEALDGGPDAERDYGQGVGGPSEGCVVEAYKEVRGPDWQRVSVLHYELQWLNRTAMQRVRADPRLAHARDAWQACMSDAGFDVDSPQAAVDRFAPDGEHAASQSIGHDPSQAEIDLATADAECRQQVQLHQTWTDLVARHRANVAMDNPDLLAEWAEYRATFMANARALLGDDTVDTVLDA
jgi:hypothetical protein